MKKASVLLIMIFTVFIMIVPVTTYAETNINWKEYNFATTSIIVYDFDKDGYPEYVTLPYYVIDNYVLVRSPYPPSYEHGLLVDVNGDGEKELIIYNDLGDYLVYNGTEQIGSYYLLPGTPVVDMYGRAIAVGNKVLFNNKVYTFTNASGTDVYPVVAGDTLYVLYVKNGKLYLEDEYGKTYLVYNDNIKVLGAVISYNKLLAVGVPEHGGTIYIEYTLGGTTKISGYTVSIEKVIAYDPGEEAFIGYAGDKIYRIRFDSLVLDYIGQVLGYDGTALYVFSDGYIKVYSPVTGVTITKIKPPLDKAPDVFGAKYPYIAMTYGTKTYVVILKPAPAVFLIIPYSVTAGDRVYYRLEVANAEEYTLLLNGTKIPTTGYIVFNKTGTYIFTASASNGIVTVTKTYKVVVEPRPLVISVRILGTPTVFEKVPLRLEVLDGINGSKVYTTCTVILPEHHLNISSWKDTNITLLPVKPTSLDIPVQIICGDNIFYKKTVYNVTVPANPAAPIIKLDYLGDGNLLINLVSPTGCTATGSVNVYVDGEFLSQGPVPYTIKGLKPGNHTIVIEYTPNVPVFRATRYTLYVHYYYNVSEVPPELISSAIIADRIKIINKTVTVVKNVTVPKPVYIEKPIVKEVLDVKTTLFFFGVGLTAGAVVGYVIRHIQLTRKRKSFEESEEQIHSGEAGEGEVGLEKA